MISQDGDGWCGLYWKNKNSVGVRWAPQAEYRIFLEMGMRDGACGSPTPDGGTRTRLSAPSSPGGFLPWTAREGGSQGHWFPRGSKGLRCRQAALHLKQPWSDTPLDTYSTEAGSNPATTLMIGWETDTSARSRYFSGRIAFSISVSSWSEYWVM
jgi:hypothetical protein